MPKEVLVILATLGAVLFLLALLGGNFKFFSAHIVGTIGPVRRWISGVSGVALLAFVMVVAFPRDSRKPPNLPSPGVGAGTTKPYVPKKPDAPGKPSDKGKDAVAAMQWIEQRCGPKGIALVVPLPPGSRIDVAARAFADALANSGVRPTPMVWNFPGHFMAGGRFSVDKFDEWYRGQSVREACMLAIVPEEVREQFPTPRININVAGAAYGIVLPRGLLAEGRENWSSVFVKAGNDPDFSRETGRASMSADVVPIR